MVAGVSELVPLLGRAMLHSTLRRLHCTMWMERDSPQQHGGIGFGRLQFAEQVRRSRRIGLRSVREQQGRSGL